MRLPRSPGPGMPLPSICPLLPHALRVLAEEGPSRSSLHVAQKGWQGRAASHGGRRAVPAVRGERSAALREWVEVGLPPGRREDHRRSPAEQVDHPYRVFEPDDVVVGDDQHRRSGDRGELRGRPVLLLGSEAKGRRDDRRPALRVRRDLPICLVIGAVPELAGVASAAGDPSSGPAPQPPSTRRPVITCRRCCLPPAVRQAGRRR